MLEGINVVWFKRDLRHEDHVPLVEATCSGAVTPIYVVEPEYWKLPDASGRQWAFTAECLLDLQNSLNEIGLPLIVRTGDIVSILSDLHARFGVKSLFSHEETGNAWTFNRDKRVDHWSKTNHVTWFQYPQFGVVRKLKDRDGWASKWDTFMGLSPIMLPAELENGPDLNSDPIPSGVELGMASDLCPERQTGGRMEGLRVLSSFLQTRGQAYHKEMSSPNSAFDSCSRLSPYVAYGALSMREVVQATRTRVSEVREKSRFESGTWRAALSAFSARLHWHCHFIQKLEDDPRFEYSNVHRAFDNIRDEKEPDAERLKAWTTGHTGYPFVDACMRALNQRGWLNFRMRAMLMSFASYQLWLHWRETGLCLARKFTDYEPGIHWNQVQMQSGTTGINTVRIYNPVKQSHDQDPDGQFIRQWVPELKRVNEEFIHEPWTMTPMEQKMVGCVIGEDYPERIVEHMEAARFARTTIYDRKKSREFREEAKHINQKHGSRKKIGKKVLGKYAGAVVSEISRSEIS